MQRNPEDEAVRLITECKRELQIDGPVEVEKDSDSEIWIRLPRSGVSLFIEEDSELSATPDHSEHSTRNIHQLLPELRRLPLGSLLRRGRTGTMYRVFVAAHDPGSHWEPPLDYEEELLSSMYLVCSVSEMFAAITRDRVLGIIESVQIRDEQAPSK